MSESLSFFLSFFLMDMLSRCFLPYSADKSRILEGKGHGGDLPRCRGVFPGRMGEFTAHALALFYSAAGRNTRAVHEKAKNFFM